MVYGIDKYPEPLNPNTWSMIETINHAIDEGIDKLHYLVMLIVKMEQVLVESNIPYTYDRIETISSMIENTIEDLDYLVKLGIGLKMEAAEKESERIKQLDTINKLNSMSHYGLTVPAASIKNAMTAGVSLWADGVNLAQSGADMDGDTLRVFTKEELEAKKAGLK